MATINKSLTTYLPAQSLEWLEKYCLDYKHLQNKDGNPKLGTAIADIIARFGRYPHRNEALGRESTAEETVFLNGPGSSFW